MNMKEGTIDTTGIQMPQLVFTCKICDTDQIIYSIFTNIFPVCDNCLKDLKEIIEAKRSINPSSNRKLI